MSSVLCPVHLGACAHWAQRDPIPSGRETAISQISADIFHDPHAIDQCLHKEDIQKVLSLVAGDTMHTRRSLAQRCCGTLGVVVSEGVLPGSTFAASDYPLIAPASTLALERIPEEFQATPTLWSAYRKIFLLHENHATYGWVYRLAIQKGDHLIPIPPSPSPGPPPAQPLKSIDTLPVNSPMSAPPSHGKDLEGKRFVISPQLKWLGIALLIVGIVMLWNPFGWVSLCAAGCGAAAFLLSSPVGIGIICIGTGVEGVYLKMSS